MSNFLTLLSVILSSISLIVIIVSVIVWGGKIVEGQRCQLRSTMLHIYYKHSAENKIRQYEYENFYKCYEAYKALKGNSFIDRIYEEIKTWDIVS